MFELVHTNGDKEAPYARRVNLLDAELLEQVHLRSIAHGSVELRKVKKSKAKKK